MRSNKNVFRSTEVAFLLLTQWPRVRFSAFVKSYFDVADLSRRQLHINVFSSLHYKLGAGLAMLHICNMLTTVGALGWLTLPEKDSQQ